MSKTALNVFQRGILQKVVTVLAYFGSIALGAFILDWADKQLFATTIKEAELRGIIPPDASLASTASLYTRQRWHHHLSNNLYWS